MRTDANRNPTAFDTAVAAEAGLKLGVDYQQGESFPAPSTLHTALLLGDPVQLTIRVIDAVGFYITKSGEPRWTYMGEFPKFVWDSLPPASKRDVIGFMYQREGGVTMRPLFPHYGQS